MRRLPVYFLLDVSGSMNGSAIIRAQEIIEEFRICLVNDPYAKETANVSLIAYGQDVTILRPLMPLSDFSFNPIKDTSSGPKNLGAALSVLNSKQSKEWFPSTSSVNGDQAPLVIIITKGKPSDVQKFVQESKQTKKIYNNIIVIHGNMDKSNDYIQLTDKIYSWETEIKGLYQKILYKDNVEIASTSNELPAPPKTIEIIIK